MELIYVSWACVMYLLLLLKLSLIIIFILFCL